MSSIEMQASGLPLIASDLQGLSETIEPNVTGQLFSPGDHQALATIILEYVNNPARREAFSKSARERVVNNFSLEKQVSALAKVMQSGNQIKKL